MIMSMPALSSLKGLPAQASGSLFDLQLSDNPALSELNGLSWLKSVQSMFIDGSGKSAAVRSGKSAAPKKERDKP
jgi:hypothetical protein